MTPLAWTLVHFLWQGALIALALALALRSGALTASIRYALGVAALALMVVVAAGTFTVLARAQAGTPLSVPSTPAVGWFSAADPGDRGLTRPADAARHPLGEGPAGRPYAAAIVAIWVVGVLALSLRLLGGWVVAGRAAGRAARPAAPEVAAVATIMSARLGLKRAVRIVESSRVAVPSVIGWLRPVVLLPAAALTGLAPGQLEALLAHELAHVRRGDYLINLLQMVVETLLFYHPAVWWVSRQVRAEREHCCDDLAVRVCDRLEYVNALSTLAQITTRPRLALAATDGSLVGRVRRLLAPPAPERGVASVWLSAVTAVVIVGCIPVVLASLRAEGRRGTLTPAAGERRAADAALPGSPGGASERPASLVDQPPAESPQQQPVTPRVEVSERIVADTPELVRITAELEAAEETSRQMERQRRDLDRQARDEEARRELAEVTARLSTLRGVLAEMSARVNVGVQNAGDLAGLQEQIGTAQRRAGGIQADMQRHRLADALEERRLEHDLARQALMQRYTALLQTAHVSAGTEQQTTDRAAQAQIAEAMREQQQALVRQTERVTATSRAAESGAQGGRAVAGPPAGPVVTLTVHGQERASLWARDRPYTQGGPAIAVPVSPGESAHTSDGQVITGIQVIGWREREAVRVLVFALVPRAGTPHDFTMDESLVARVDAGTYLLVPGQTQTLDEVAALGVKGVSLRIRDAPR